MFSSRAVVQKDGQEQICLVLIEEKTYEKPATIGFAFIKTRQKRIGKDIAGFNSSIASGSVDIGSYYATE